MQNNYTYSAESTLKEEGDYEVFVEKMELRVLPSGTEKLFVQYRIREDVEQKYKNSCLFEDIWHEKENPILFNRKKINRILGTQPDVKEGMVFNNINDICNFMLGKYLQVHVVKQYDDYKGEEVNSIAYYRTSKNTNKQVADTQKPASVEPQQEKVDVKQFTQIKLDTVNDDDLPF